MMGRDHALLGFAAYEALAAGALPAAGVPAEYLPQKPLDFLFWGVVAAGFALAPDIDEPGSTVARVLGPVSRGASVILRKAFGGHRYGTHSWVFIVLGALLGYASVHVPLVAALTVGISMVLGFRMLAPDHARKMGVLLMLGGAAMGTLAYQQKVSLGPILLAIPLGILLHDLGDFPTNHGIAFLWPWRKRYGLGLFSTGKGFELHVVRPVLIVACLACVAFYTAIPAFHALQMDHNNIHDFVASSLYTR